MRSNPTGVHADLSSTGDAAETEVAIVMLGYSRVNRDFVLLVILFILTSLLPLAGCNSDDDEKKPPATALNAIGETCKAEPGISLPAPICLCEALRPRLGLNKRGQGDAGLGGRWLMQQV